MKNIYKIIFIFLFAFNTRLKAQDHFFSLALNASNVSSLGSQNFQQPGIFASFGWSNPIEFLKDSRINHGFAYSQKGARKSPDPKNNNYQEYNIKLHYAEVFLNTWVKMKSVKAIAGFTFGYLLSSKTTGTVSAFANDPNFRKIDFNIQGGVGTLVGKRFFPSLIVNYSVFPIKNMSGIGTIGFSRGPRNIVFSVGCTWLLFKKVETELEDEVQIP